MIVSIVGDLLSILLYADDMYLIVETAQDIQEMLDILNVWCKKWKLQVNSQKTQVVHFCLGPSIECIQFKFHYGDSEIVLVDKYTSLELVFSAFLDYEHMAKLVAQSAHRALGLLVAKCKSHGDMSFTCFSKLYDHQVYPIIDFGAATPGYMNFASQMQSSTKPVSFTWVWQERSLWQNCMVKLVGNNPKTIYGYVWHISSVI